MIKRIFILLLGIILISGLIWILNVSFIQQLFEKDRVFVFYLDIFGFFSVLLFGGFGFLVVGIYHRIVELIKNQDIKMSVIPFWIAFVFFAIIGLIINYSNYFVNIKNKGLISCEFHVQRHKDWMLNKYARTVEDCEKKGTRNVSD